MEETEKETINKILTNYIRKHGYRKTVERYALLEAAYTINKHFTADQLYEYMEEKGTFRVSRATTYNNLQLFVDAKLLTRHQMGEQMRYEASYSNRPHYHTICTRCGAIMEIEDSNLQETFSHLQTRKFVPASYQLYIYGLCGKCAWAQRRKKKEKNKIQTKQDQPSE